MSRNDQLLSPLEKLGIVVGIVFVILKLTNLINFDWFWVLFPFWIGFIIMFSVGFISGLVQHFANKNRSKSWFED